MEISATTPLPMSSADPQQLAAGLNNPKISDEARMSEAARQFEAIFLRQFLEKALEPSMEGILGDGGTAGSIYRSQMIEMMADQMSQAGGMGLGTTLQQAIQQHG